MFHFLFGGNPNDIPSLSDSLNLKFKSLELFRGTFWSLYNFIMEISKSYENKFFQNMMFISLLVELFSLER